MPPKPRAPGGSLALRATAAASGLVDRGVAAWMKQRMGAAPSRAPLPADARRRVEQLVAHYQAADLFAPLPDAPAQLADARAGSAGAATVTDLSFESLYRPTLATYRAEHARYQANLTAHARWWRRTSERVAPTVILLHGWSQGPFWMVERMLERAAWHAAGFDVAALELPFHGQRAPAPADDDDRALGPASGLYFPSPHIARTNEGFGQAIADLRQLGRELRARGAPAIGVAGVSLGGYVAALWASLDDDLAFALTLAPAVELAALMATHGRGAAAWRRAAAAGVDADLLADAFACHAPRTRAPRLPPQRLFVIAGRGDQITGGAQAEQLARHQGTEVRWFAGGHVAQIGAASVLRRTIDDAAAALGLAS
jgi:pimeloyl-ACP methyl ester carboxylesterase